MLFQVWNRCGASSQCITFVGHVHLCDRLKRQLNAGNTHQAVIPGGCTSLLQLLDLSLNKPFKGNIRQMWNEWMESGTKEYTKGGAMKRPALSLVAEWVVKAWEAVPEEMVRKSLRKCGTLTQRSTTTTQQAYSRHFIRTISRQIV